MESGLQVAEDRAFAQREQRVQRLGSGLMALLVILAFLGLAGNGPLSDATATAEGLAVDYHRVGRSEAPGRMVIRVAGASGTQGPLELSISRSWLDGFEVEGITPAPDRTTTDQDEVLLSYASRPAEVVLDLRYQSMGHIAGEVRVPGQRVHLASFVLP